MAVYDKDGVSAVPYDRSGFIMSVAYDKDGVEVYEDKYSIENVVSYYRTPTQTVCTDINALSNDWTSFVFIADPHGAGNENHSQAIGLYVLDNTPATMLVLGGDYCAGQWDETEYDNYMSPLLNSNLMRDVYAVIGNHEAWNGFSASKGAVYNDFLKDKTNIVGSLQDCYFYLDDSTRKIRYMFLNTSDGADDFRGWHTVSAAQLAWISQNVILPSAEWSLLVIGHITLNTMGGITYENEENGTAVESAIKGCNGTIIGYLCGHQHCDILYNDGDMEHVTLICDRFSNANYYEGISVTDRVKGTTSEQAVSVVSINTTTKQVVIRRIGAGRNQTLSYTY